MNDIRARVESVIEAQAHCAGDTLESYDWLDWIQLACDLEEEFEIQLSDRELEDRNSAEAITVYIEQLMNQDLKR